MQTSHSSHRVYEEHSSGSFRILELVSLESARRMVKTKAVNEALEQDGVTPCFVRVKIAGRPKLPLGVRFVNPQEPALERSSTAFTLPEMNALAGTKFKHGSSLTAKMTEEQRKARKDRRGRQLPPEDLVERATKKKQAWEQLGPALQDLVREAGVASGL